MVIHTGQSVADIKVPYETDVVIIGGGIIGSSVAYWLKQRNPKGFTCTVIEQDPKYTQVCEFCCCTCSCECIHV